MTFRFRTARLLAPLALALAGCAGPHAGGSPSPESKNSFDPSASPAALVAYADSAITSGDAELARRALERAATIAPDSASVWIGYGRYYTAARRYKDAKTEFERAMGLAPASPEPHYWLGVAYLHAGQQQDALGEFRRALRLDPGYAPAQDAIRPLMESKYVAAGVPGEYAAFPQRSSLSRGELGVALAVELGADPDRPTWRSGPGATVDRTAIDAAWGSRWLGASVDRGWIPPYPDGEFHLADPVTRGTLAILVSEIAARATVSAVAGMSREATAPIGDPAQARFPDLQPGSYLARPASRAVGFGLPAREDGRFDAQALATGLETLQALQGLARHLGATPIVSGEPH